MSSVDAPLRLIPGEPPETEWRYLVNETLAGERCIVPLLEELLTHPAVTPALKTALEQQTDEERSHVSLYESLLGPDQLEGTGFEMEFARLVRGLQPLGLRLFAIQEMLEEISLGSLAYRLRIWSASPSKRADMSVLRDEIRHIRLPFPHLSAVIQAEGKLDKREFRAVSQQVNRIFQRAFCGRAIVGHVVANYGRCQNTPEQIEATDAMTHFRKNSARIVARTKRKFLSQYYS